jgi:hypothetical protein
MKKDVSRRLVAGVGILLRSAPGGFTLAPSAFKDSGKK